MRTTEQANALIKEMLEALKLIEFAVTKDGGVAEGKYDVAAIREIATAAVRKAEGGAK